MAHRRPCCDSFCPFWSLDPFLVAVAVAVAVVLSPFLGPFLGPFLAFQVFLVHLPRVSERQPVEDGLVAKEEGCNLRSEC